MCVYFPDRTNSSKPTPNSRVMSTGTLIEVALRAFSMFTIVF